MKNIKSYDKFFESYEFTFNGASKFFEKLYYPDFNVTKSKKYLTVDYKSPYNYDILIEFKFNIESGEYESGRIIHEVNDWKYDLKDVKSIRGFEDNEKDFIDLIKVTKDIVNEGIEQLKEVVSKEPTMEVEGDLYYDTDFLREIAKDKISKMTYRGMF